MIKVFYGENRVAAMEAVKKFLGENYEVVEGEELLPQDLPNLFWGTSLFAEVRTILVRDLFLNKAVLEDLPKYLDTKHNIVFLESRVDKRSNVYKSLKSVVEFSEFKMPQDENARLIFDIYNTAKRDGEKAVAMLEKIKQNQEPIMFEGLMISQAIKDYAARPNAKEKRALMELSKLDTKLKSSGMDPWMLIEAFLISF